MFTNIKYTRILKKIYKEEDLLKKFSQLFNTEFRIDWVGRIYTVINPNIINSESEVNTQIYEYGENGLSNSMYIEHWIMTRLNLVKNFIMANNLFDLLTYRIEKLDEYENYLFVIEPITFEDCKKWTKIFGITYVSLISLAVIIQLIFHIL